MEKYLLYVANSTCPQYFCGERQDGTLLFCASKSLAVMLPEYAREVWFQIISDRTGHKPLTLPVDAPSPVTRDTPRVQLRCDRVSHVRELCPALQQHFDEDR
jgi:hypothetical protein